MGRLLIALATCRRLPEPDPDAAPLVRELRRLGARAELAAWDDPGVDWSRFDLCVIRSTWDYIHRLPGFLAWAERVSRRTRLFNPPGIIRWNTDKGYLRALARRGVPVVPTWFIPRGAVPDLARGLKRRGWGEIVIKPRVGAGSFATRRFGPEELDEASAFLRRMKAAALVQPYLPAVEGRGERALVWIAGELTHAVRKAPRFEGQAERVSVRPVSIGSDERAFAARVLSPYSKNLLYARVDCVRGADGRLLLMELELVEPSLFLRQSRRAMLRLARACLASADKRRLDEASAEG